MVVRRRIVLPFSSLIRIPSSTIDTKTKKLLCHQNVEEQSRILGVKREKLKMGEGDLEIKKEEMRE